MNWFKKTEFKNGDIVPCMWANKLEYVKIIDNNYKTKWFEEERLCYLVECPWGNETAPFYKSNGGGMHYWGCYLINNKFDLGLIKLENKIYNFRKKLAKQIDPSD